MSFENFFNIMKLRLETSESQQNRVDLESQTPYGKEFHKQRIEAANKSEEFFDVKTEYDKKYTSDLLKLANTNGYVMCSGSGTSITFRLGRWSDVY